MQQEVLLAMLAEGPSYAYDLQSRLGVMLGPLGAALNGGQVYVTLGRLEKSGLVEGSDVDHGHAAVGRPERKVYALTARGEDRVAEWLAEVSWPKPDLSEFHLKLVTAAAARLADPIGIIDDQRRELLRLLRNARRVLLAEVTDSDEALLAEAVVLRLRSDLRWLDACETVWTNRRHRARPSGDIDPEPRQRQL
jgi:DNA-binding PadR family transcriptional regulator